MVKVLKLAEPCSQVLHGFDFPGVLSSAQQHWCLGKSYRMTSEWNGQLHWLSLTNTIRVYQQGGSPTPLSSQNEH